MHGGEVVAKVTSSQSARVRAFGIVLAVMATSALVASPAAFGAEDSVASGKLALKYSSGFKKQLKKNGVKLKPKSLSINGGKLDPVTGTGTVNLKGKLTFKKGGKKLVYKKLTAKLGSGGVLKGSSGKVFKLKGGKVARNGFGANVTGVKLKFLKSAAKKVNKKLELNSLHQGSAGKANANNVQPSEVTLVSGTSELLPNVVTLGKFPHHCVNPTPGTGGLDPVPPASETATPSFVFPITGGDASPAGTSGAVNTGGGIQITQNIATGAIDGVAPFTCAEFALTGTRRVTQTDLTLDLTTKQIQAHVVIGGTGNTALDGDKGTAFIATTTGGTVSADPATRKITLTGATAAFNATAALVLNGTFPCQSGDGFDPSAGCTGANAFVAGDVIGTISFTGQAQ
jgi:hypothetical protein